MRWSRVFTAIAILAVIATVFMASSDASEDEGESVTDTEIYTISYRLNGGCMDTYAPDRYVHGSYLPLPFPYKEGYLFAGWCTEAKLTNQIGGIPSTLRGHVILYAKWIEDDRVGTGWTMRVEGSYGNGSTTVSGTATSGYVYKDGDAVLLTTENDILYRWSDGSSCDDRSLASWIVRMTDGFRYVETDRTTGVCLTVWVDQNGNRIWLRDMIVPVRIETTFSDGGMITQTLIDEYRFDPDLDFTPVIESDYPLVIEGAGRSRIGEDVTLTAEGDGFKGWRLNGELVSTERTCTFSRLTHCDRITAESDCDFIVVKSGSEISGLGFGGSRVFDSEGESVSDLEMLEAGCYRAVKTEDGITTTMRFVVEDHRTFVLDWEYAGGSYSIEVPLLFSEMYSDQYEHSSIPRFFQRSQSLIEAFHTPDSITLRSIASQLRSMYPDADRTAYAEFVLKFVQTIPYIEDLESRGSEEYWKFPLETLWDGGGDCEDKSILYNTLMGISGYRVAFIMFKDHAMSAVTVDGEGESMIIDNYRFMMAETTWTLFSLGQSSKDHMQQDSIFSCRVECFDYGDTVRAGI